MAKAPKPAWAALLAAACLAPAAAQVNTESLRRRSQDEGLHGAVEAGATLVSGNSDFAKADALGRLDWLRGKWHVFGVGNYEVGRQAGKTFLHNGFAHARLVTGRGGFAGIEAFSQLEFNEFLLLERRWLLGAGLRLRLYERRPPVAIHAGAGFMWESEDISGIEADPDATVRSTNYLSLRWEWAERAALDGVAYYQPDVMRPRDYRILAEAGLDFRLTRLLSLRLAAKHRFDSRPPAGVKRYDLQLENRLRLSF